MNTKRCGQKNSKFCETFFVWIGVTRFERGWYMINYSTWTKKEWWSDESIAEGDSLTFCHFYTIKSGQTKKIFSSSNIWDQTMFTNDGRPLFQCNGVSSADLSLNRFGLSFSFIIRVNLYSFFSLKTRILFNKILHSPKISTLPLLQSHHLCFNNGMNHH